METAGYILLSIVVVGWVIAILIGIIAALPFGLLALIPIIGIGLLLIKVITDRIDNKEDSYYSKNVDK